MPMSSLELTVFRLLLAANISFKREYQFHDCYNGLYRFDFVAEDLSFAIEVQGLQHYQYTSKFYKTKADFTKAQERDRRKIAYCLANNIKLYIIPCWEIPQLSTARDIFNEKFLAKTKFHNDEVWRHQKSK